MAPHKCNYIIFNNGKKDISGELNLILNGIRLAHDSSPTFLGIRFDPNIQTSDCTLKENLHSKTQHN